MEGQNEHHDHGLAHDDAIHSGAFGFDICAGNRRFEMIRRSRECVIQTPMSDLVEVVVEIGNTSGAKIDKFQKFRLTAVPGDKVDPLIEECYANFECRLADGRLISKYEFFIWEVAKAHVAVSSKYPKTLHYRGDGVFMISGGSLNRTRKFKPQNLDSWSHGSQSKVGVVRLSRMRSDKVTGGVVHLTIDPARIGRCEEHNDRRDVLGLGDASNRRRLLTTGQEAGCVQSFGGNEARINGVDADSTA